MIIAVDAMGTDNRPTADVAGAVEFARASSDTIVLVGNKALIEKELGKHDLQNVKIEIVPSEEEIMMDEKPTAVLKGKPKSSMHVGMQLVKDGGAEAFVTMGNTGAALAIATLSVLRRLPKVKRPAMAAIYPLHKKEKVILDVGANADSRAEWLQQFALMGSIYSEDVLSISRPRVGLLSNGEEDAKGNALIREAHDLISQLELNFVGNIEPSDVINDNVDVVVMDGFVGNVFIKTFESSVRYVTQLIRQEIGQSPVFRLGAGLARPAFRSVRNHLDTDAYGGAPLLGVEGVVIIGHGGSSPAGVKGALWQARTVVQHKITDTIQAKLAKYY